MRLAIASINRMVRGNTTKGDHWEENYERSWKMLEEAGVKIQFYDDEYGGL